MATENNHEVSDPDEGIFGGKEINLPTAIAITICLGSLTAYYEIKDWGTQFSWKLKNRSSVKSN